MNTQTTSEVAGWPQGKQRDHTTENTSADHTDTGCEPKLNDLQVVELTGAPQPGRRQVTVEIALRVKELECGVLLYGKPEGGLWRQLEAFDVPYMSHMRQAQHK